MCSIEELRVRPTITPRARGSQYGAPSPTNAGTRYTPSVSFTCDISFSTSADAVIAFKPSRSHCTAAPAMNTEPSSAYVVLPPIFHATVVSSPFSDGTGLSPVLSSMKQPVPYVFFAEPGSKQ